MLNFKGKYFLNLLEDNLHPIKPLYIKKGVWIKHFKHLNSLCTKATKAITNYTAIKEYHLYSFPRENFSYPCGSYSVEIRHYIIHNCRKFNNYWNLIKDMISQFISFLKYNLIAVFFGKDII